MMETRRLVFLLAMGAVAACSAASSDDSDDTDTGSDTGTDGNPCDVEGETSCQENWWYLCQDGEWILQETCDVLCDDEVGCVLCFPGTTYCDFDVAMQCAEDGQSTSVIQDCTELDLICQQGECVSEDPCIQALVDNSNIGCEYWAVDLDNAENSMDNAAGGQFAVAVANIGSHGTAHVEVHINNAAQGAALDLELVEAKDVEEMDLYIFLLPRRDADGDNITVHTDDGPQTWLSSRAFRITSDVPVVAYQFNPLDQRFSNDASLLISTAGLGKDHMVLGYPPGAPLTLIGRNRGYITVLGVEEQTEVTFTTTATIEAGQGIDAIPEGGSATFEIGPFDVLNLETKLYTVSEMTQNPSVDLTGSTVISDKPVVVFFGVDLTGVDQTELFPESCCAEHLEQQILPSLAMGQKFVVSHSAQRNTGTAEMDYYRVMAYETATVTTNLPAPDNQFSLAVGEFREFFVNHGFTIEATSGYLHVAQLLVEAGNTNVNIGDAALLYVPAVDQRRGLYVFTTGEGFESNWAVISMPQGTEARIDGLDVATTCDGPKTDGVMDSVTYQSWTCQIDDGAHVVHSGPAPEEAETPIGVFVYGYYYAGSYAYPAGSDLRWINPTVVE